MPVAKRNEDAWPRFWLLHQSTFCTRLRSLSCHTNSNDWFASKIDVEACTEYMAQEYSCIHANWQKTSWDWSATYQHHCDWNPSSDVEISRYLSLENHIPPVFSKHDQQLSLQLGDEHGFLQVFQWISVGFLMDSRRFSNGFPKIFQWISVGFPMDFLRVSNIFT